MKRGNGFDIPETVDEAVDLDRTALLVYDMQVGIVRQLAHAAGIVGKVGQVLSRGARGWPANVLPPPHVTAEQLDGRVPASASARMAAQGVRRGASPMVSARI